MNKTALQAPCSWNGSETKRICDCVGAGLHILRNIGICSCSLTEGFHFRPLAEIIVCQFCGCTTWHEASRDVEQYKVSWRREAEPLDETLSRYLLFKDGKPLVQ